MTRSRKPPKPRRPADALPTPFSLDAQAQDAQLDALVLDMEGWDRDLDALVLGLATEAPFARPEEDSV